MGSGPPTPTKNHKNIGFLSNTGPDPLKTTKQPSQHSMLGHHRHASETPFKWRVAGGPMMARGIWILPPLINYKEEKKRCQIGPLLTKLSGSAHASPCSTATISVYLLLQIA